MGMNQSHGLEGILPLPKRLAIDYPKRRWRRHGQWWIYEGWQPGAGVVWLELDQVASKTELNKVWPPPTEPDIEDERR